MLKKQLAYWQPLLLPEWRVVLKPNQPTKKMTVGGDVCDGLCWWSTEDAVAEVWIRRGAKLQEWTLVHELLHVRLEGHAEKNDHYDMLYERALNTLSERLVAFKNGTIGSYEK